MSANKMINQNREKRFVQNAETKEKNIQRCSCFYESNRKDQKSMLESSRRPEWTYVSVPLEMLVDKPERCDIGYKGEETGNNPPDIMR